MSVLDALFVSVCWSSFFSVYSSVVSVDLLERAVSPDLVLVQLGRVYRSLEACRTILSGFFSFNPVASVDRLKVPTCPVGLLLLLQLGRIRGQPGVCRPV